MLGLGKRVLSRWQAAGIHLGCSALLAIAAGILLFGVWYPQPYTAAAGADRLIVLLIGIDLVIGPLLTLIVYRHGKRGMAFDIGFIASVQLAALVYGLLVIADSRPVYVVVAKDMVYLTMASSLSDEDLRAAGDPRFRRRAWTGPVLVAAPPPESQHEREVLLESGLAGKDIDRLPRYYRDFAKAGPALVATAPKLSLLGEYGPARELVARFVQSQGKPIETLHFLPLRGRNPEQDTVIVFAVDAAAPLGTLSVDPWPVIERWKRERQDRR